MGMRRRKGGTKGEREEGERGEKDGEMEQWRRGYHAL